MRRHNSKKIAERYRLSQLSLNAARLKHKQGKAPQALYAINIAAKTEIFRVCR